MKPTLKIFVDRLHGGKSELITEELDPGFMDISEKEVAFKDPIKVEGEAYLAEDWLIVRLSIIAHATLQCALCNDTFRFPIHLQDMMHEEPLENIREATYDLLPLIRESILLEIPFYPQCGITKCNKRQEVEKYLKKEPKVQEEKKGINGHKPFQDML
jgi:uncharacterized metal-binding protein YceD (DUF177 family)